tara:strand:+ start:1102 stop:1524 length:423 start_codon:yes stop_codon:yes gene_type:complete
MNDKQHTNINRNTLTISTLHNSNNMKNLQQLQNKVNNTFENIDSIVWFGLNYNYDFIDQCWSDNPCLANHLNDKFSMCTQEMLKRDGEKSNDYVVRKAAISYGVFTRFITMLDSANREKLYQYILETYSKEYGWSNTDRR